MSIDSFGATLIAIVGYGLATIALILGASHAILLVSRALAKSTIYMLVLFGAAINLAAVTRWLAS